MVPHKEWMLLFLVAIKSLEAFENINDRKPLEDCVQYEVVHDSIDQSKASLTDPVLISGREPKAGQSHSGHEPIHGYQNKQDENPRGITGPLWGHPKAEINRNSAKEKENLVAIVYRKDRIRNLFRFFEQNQEKMEKFGHEAEGKSISTVLTELKEIGNDIDGFFQIQLRKWGPSDRTVRKKEAKIRDMGRHPHELVDNPIKKDMEINSGVQAQQHMDYGAALQDPEMSDMIPGHLSQVERLEQEKSREKGLDPTEKKVEGHELGALHSELRDHALEIVYEGLMERRFKNLFDILLSITFPKLGEIKGTSEAERNPIRKLKLGFEKSMFLATQLMNEFGLIMNEVFENFLHCPQIHEIIANHLVELFHVVKHGTYSHPLSFIPDMELLSKHWKTVHLHKLFTSLNKSQKAQMIYTALVAQVSIWTQTCGKFINFSCPEKIRTSFLEGKLLTELEKWESEKNLSKTHDTKRDPPLTENGQRIVDYFQDPDSRRQHCAVVQYVLETEYYHNYYLLRFIETYHQEYLKSLFSKSFEYQTLLKQLDLFEEGIKAYQIIKTGYMYRELVAGDNAACNFITVETAMNQIPITQKEFQLTCDRYIELKNNFENLLPDSESLDIWFDSLKVSSGIIEKFNRKCNQPWEKNMEGEALRIAKMREADREINFNPCSSLNAFEKKFPLNCVSNF